MLEFWPKANKEYGLFSSAARKKTNKLIAEAAKQQNKMLDISNTAELQRLNAQYMGEQSGLAYQTLMDGGYNQKYTYAAKYGGVLDQNIPEQLEWEPQIELNWELPTFKEGGNIDFVEELEWIPEFKSGGKTEELDVPEIEEAPPFDGHMPDDVDRLLSLVKKEDEQGFPIHLLFIKILYYLLYR